MKPNWGDVPTWATAIATLFTFGGALYAGLKAKDLLKVERARDAKTQERDFALRDQEIRTQASQIAGWVFPDPLESAGLYGRPVYKLRVSAIVRNPTPQPIYDVVISWRFESRGQKSDAINLVAPEDVHTWPLPDHFYNLLGPNYHQELKISRQEIYELSEHAAQRFQLIFTFKDSQGQRWKRDEKGTLTMLPSVVLDAGTEGAQEDEKA